MKNEILLFPYGGAYKWVHLTLREFNAIRYVLIITNDEKIDRKKDSSLSFFEKAVQESKKLLEQEILQEIPENLQVQIKILKVPFFQQFTQYFGFFRSLIIQVVPFMKSPTKYQKYCDKESTDPVFQNFFKDNKITKIHIHLDSGLMIYRLALYQCANEFRDLSIHLFMYNKVSHLAETIPIHHDRNDIEDNVLEILENYEYLSVSELLSKFSVKYEKKSLSYMLKVVNRLNRMGYIESKKVGRRKLISLSPLSSDAFNQEKYSNILRNNFSDL